MRVAGVVVKYLHIHVPRAKLVGNALDHPAGLIHLVDDAAGATYVLAVTGRDDCRRFSCQDAARLETAARP